MRELSQLIGVVVVSAAVFVLLPAKDKPVRGPERSGFAWAITDSAPSVPPAAPASNLAVSDLIRDMQKGGAENTGNAMTSMNDVIASSVVRVRAFTGSNPGTAQIGSAVALNGGGSFATAAHLTRGIPGPISVQIQDSGDKYVSASFRPINGFDVALVEGNAAGVVSKLRSPKYLERVSLYGTATEKVQTGTVTNSNQLNGQWTVSLDDNETFPGIRSGDSGGGVFGQDGALLGIITDTNTYNAKVVYFVDAKVLMAKPQRSAQPTSPSASVKQTNQLSTSPSGQNCANGQCNQVQQYQMSQPQMQNSYELKPYKGPLGRTRWK